MPLISFITTVYNNEKYLKSAVYSVLNQGFRDIEYIIVDDGSTDNTPVIADNIALEDKRVRVIHQKNQWIYAGFNRGIKEAKGKYIYILNSDDRLFDGAINKMVDIVKKYEPDVIWTKVIIDLCDYNQKILKKDISNLSKTITKDYYFGNKEQNQKNWTELVKKSIAWNQANLYKRDIMIKHPFRNDVYGGDVLFNISIADDINTSYVLEYPVYEFLQYDSKKMNASIGKYYGYEHSMFNDFYFEQKKIYDKWSTVTSDDYKYIQCRRIKNITSEINSYLGTNCNLKIEEKLEKIFRELGDGVAYKCAQNNDRTEEFDSRVLSGLRALFIKEVPEENSKYRFMYDMLESLLRYEKEADDFKIIKDAIDNPLNKYHIGQAFYEKIKGDENNV